MAALGPLLAVPVIRTESVHAVLGLPALELPGGAALRRQLVPLAHLQRLQPGLGFLSALGGLALTFPFLGLLGMLPAHPRAIQRA